MPPTHLNDLSDYEPGAEGGVGSAEGIGDGNRTVTTAGTRVPLAAASTPCTSVIITAKETNTGTIVVGGVTVVAAIGTRQGHPLRARESVVIDILDLNSVYLDATVSGEGVVYAYLT